MHCSTKFVTFIRDAQCGEEASEGFGDLKHHLIVMRVVTTQNGFPCREKHLMFLRWFHFGSLITWSMDW